jgi:hypothetical protein
MVHRATTLYLAQLHQPAVDMVLVHNPVRLLVVMVVLVVAAAVVALQPRVALATHPPLLHLKVIMAAMVLELAAAAAAGRVPLVLHLRPVLGAMAALALHPLFRGRL